MGKAFEHATVWSGVAEIFFGKFKFYVSGLRTSVLESFRRLPVDIQHLWAKGGL